MVSKPRSPSPLTSTSTFHFPYASNFPFIYLLPLLFPSPLHQLQVYPNTNTWYHSTSPRLFFLNKTTRIIESLVSPLSLRNANPPSAEELTFSRTSPFLPPTLLIILSLALFLGSIFATRCGMWDLSIVGMIVLVHILFLFFFPLKKSLVGHRWGNIYYF